MSKTTEALLCLGLALATSGACVAATPLVETASAIADAQPLSHLQDERIGECSGLAASLRDTSLLWTHNDSGDTARVFAINLKGETVATVNFTNAEAHDWEDIGVARLGAGRAALPYIYAGDIGDNGSRRQSIQIYRLQEPVLPRSAAAKGEMRMEIDRSVERLDLIYPDGPHNAETLLAQPDGNLVVVTKSLQGSSLYRTPRPFQNGATLTLVKVGDLQFGGEGFATRLATGGDFSQDGRKLAIVTYANLYEWQLPKPYNVEGLKISEARVRGLPRLKQCEAVCYAFDGKHLYLCSEKEMAPLYDVPSALASWHGGLTERRNGTH